MFHDQEYFSHIYITIACKRKFGPDDTMDRGIYIKNIYIHLMTLPWILIFLVLRYSSPIQSISFQGVGSDMM